MERNTINYTVHLTWRCQHQHFIFAQSSAYAILTHISPLNWELFHVYVTRNAGRIDYFDFRAKLGNQAPPHS